MKSIPIPQWDRPPLCASSDLEQFDPLGSYTAITVSDDEIPVQDADDL